MKKFILSFLFIGVFSSGYLYAIEGMREVVHFDRDAHRIDIHGQSKSSSSETNSSNDVWVSVTTGSVGAAITDVDFPGFGEDELPTSLTRYFDTTRRWTKNYAMPLVVEHLSVGAYFPNGTAFYVTDENGVEYSYYIPYDWSNAYNPASFPAIAYSKEGRLHTLTYDAENAQYILTKYDGKVYRYSFAYQTGIGRYIYYINSIKDRNGNEMTYEYEGQIRLSSISMNGNSVQLAYSTGENGETLVNMNAGGSHWIYAYNNYGWLMTVTDPAGKKTTYGYNSLGILTSIMDPLGNKTSFLYIEPEPFKYKIVRITDAAGNITSFRYINENETEVTDPRGIVTRYVHLDPENKWYTGFNSEYIETRERFVYDKRTYFTDGTIHSEQFGYDYNENMNFFQDAYGNQYHWELDNWGKTLTHTDALGNETSYTYDNSKYQKATSKTDAMGRTYTYALDSNGNRVKETDPLGNETTYQYYKGSVLQKKDRNNNVTQYEYDGWGSLTRETGSMGVITQYSRDSRGNILSHTDALGRVTTYLYDGRDLMTRITYADGKTKNFTYDANGNKTQETDENGKVTKYAYDALNRLVKVTDALNGVTNYTYDAIGNKLSQSDPIGNTTAYAYDELSRVTKVTDPLGYHTWNIYGWNSGVELLEGREFQPVKTKNSKLVETEFIYDNMGRLLYKVFQDDTSERHDYDAVGNETAVTNRDGITTNFIYDDLNRLTEKQEPENRTTHQEYDPEGNLLKLTDPKGFETNYQYDVLNRIVKVTDPEGGMVEYSYDLIGNRISIKNQNAKTTAYAFDNRNRLIKVTDALGKITQMTYDGKGNLLTKKYPNNYTLSYTYDALDRLTQETYPASVTVKYTYDKAGNRLTMIDLTGTTSYTYDKRSDVTKIVDQNGRIMQYKYDQLGNRVALIDHENQYTLYFYDKENRQTGIAYPVNTVTAANYITESQVIYDGAGVPGGGASTWDSIPGNLKTGFQYDVLNRRTRTNYPNGNYEIFWYDWCNRLLDKKLQNSTGTILRWIAYQYDANDNRTQMDDIGLDGQTHYSYDDLNRLTEIQYPGGAWARYTYDPTGNRLQETTNTKTINYTHNAANQLTQSLDNAGKKITYTYDNNGNLAQKKEYTNTTLNKTTNYTFNYDNLLGSYSITAGTSTQTGSFSYDGDGRQFTGTRNSVTTKYVYDGLNILYDLSGSTVKARYLTELELDDMIAKKESGQTEYYHSDGLGSVVMMTNTSGNWTKRYRYDAWGNERVAEGTSSNTYTYTSRRKETDLGLLYYRARYYDSTIGRFISQDPFSGGPDDARISYENKMTSRLNGEFTQYNSFRDPHTFNRYVYVKNNPLRYTDPLGLIGETEAIGGFKDANEQGKIRVDDKIATINNVDKNEPQNPGVGPSGGAVPALAAVTPSLAPMPLAFEGPSYHTKGKKGEKAVVIGEGMDRVKTAAKDKRARWWQFWRKGKYDPDMSLARNKRWIRSKMRQGYKIYDIGIFKRRQGGRSDNYKMESAETKGYWNLEKLDGY
jgi:RHS repeat-associated protein